MAEIVLLTHSNAELERLFSILRKNKTDSRSKMSWHKLQPSEELLRKAKEATVGSSNPEVFLEKGVLKICPKYIGEHPSRSAISIKCFATLLKSHFDMGVHL